MKVKGISSVIAIILILMIVIALAALAYTWFSGVFAGLTGTAGTAVTRTTSAMSSNFKIENAKNVTGTGGTCVAGSTSCINVTVRNLGTEPINFMTATAYVNDVPFTYFVDAPSNLLTGETSTFTIRSLTYPQSELCDKTLRLIIKTGLEQTATINC